MIKDLIILNIFRYKLHRLVKSEGYNIERNFAEDIFSSRQTISNSPYIKIEITEKDIILSKNIVRKYVLNEHNSSSGRNLELKYNAGQKIIKDYCWGYTFIGKNKHHSSLYKNHMGYLIVTYIQDGLYEEIKITNKKELDFIKKYAKIVYGDTLDCILDMINIV